MRRQSLVLALHFPQAPKPQALKPLLHDGRRAFPGLDGSNRGRQFKGLIELEAARMVEASSSSS
jgi:hypothetical protein